MNNFILFSREFLVSEFTNNLKHDFIVNFGPVPSHCPTPYEVFLVHESMSGQTWKLQTPSSALGSHPRRALAREDFPVPVPPTITIRGSGSTGVKGVEGDWPWTEEKKSRTTVSLGGFIVTAECLWCRFSVYRTTLWPDGESTSKPINNMCPHTARIYL